MAIPNVKVNVGEQTLVSSNTLVPFVPAVLLKTKSGPIGEITEITSESQFVSIFGESDITTPAAYALQRYLRTYSYVLVTRLANTSNAAKAQGTATFTNESDTIELFKATTEYKTDLFNLKEIKLVYNSETGKIWLDVSSLAGKTAISIKEDITPDTVKAAVYDDDNNLIGGLEFILNKLITSVNAMNLGIIFENKFVNKTTNDPVPSVAQFTTGFTATMSGGDSGNTTPLTTAKVQEAIELYNSQDTGLDVMVIPEYTNYEVVNYAEDLADKNNFVVLVAPGGDSISTLTSNISNYNIGTRGSLALYYPNVYYSGFEAEIPASMAVLHTYAKSDVSAKWCAPAGVARGTLNLVNRLAVNLTTTEMETLYDAARPVNCINNISGKGFVVWGNKSFSSDSSFFDRLNVARLVKYITKEVYNLSYDYLFEPITSTTFTDWEMRVEDVLDNIKLNAGLDDYVVIMDSTINTEATIAKNELNGIIKIKPLEVAEFITIDLTVTDTITVTVE